MNNARKLSLNSADMRTTFIRTLTALAEKEKDIMLITGDLGFTVLENFRDTLPNQYLNAGVAEQNMIGVAAGLAMSGKRVFVYSIIPFVTFRCLEQIRNDLCYHNLPVCVVGVGGGYSYGHMGSTHHALEDIAVLRSLANMTVICPGDPMETEAAVKAIAKLRRPCYLRLGKAGEPIIHDPKTFSFGIGKAIEITKGTTVALVSTSTTLGIAKETADLLQKQGLSVRLLSMHTVKPIDAEAIQEACTQKSLIVTVEEHSRIGGLGSAVAEAISHGGIPAKHLIFAAPDHFAERCGSQTFFRERAGLTPHAITERVLSALKS